MKFLRLTLFCLLCMTYYNLSQTIKITTITSDDILNQIGAKTLTVTGYSDSTDTIMVDVGSPGVDQMWDFRTVELPDTFFIDTVKYIDPRQTKLAEIFPNSNYAVSTITNKITLNDTIKNYAFDVTFYNVNSENSIAIGNINSNIHNNLSDTLVTYSNDTTMLPEDIEFGETAKSVFYDTTYITSPLNGDKVIGSTIIDSTVNTIDGYGILKLPAGNFQCYRIRSYLKSTVTKLSGFPIVYTVTYIGYTWVNYKGVELASISSLPYSTDPYFTKAGAFLRLESIIQNTVGIKDKTHLPNNWRLNQNYPNPFNPTTTIKYDLPKEVHVTLRVYNILGQEVATLVNGVKQAGSYEATFDASNMSSGIYYYSLKAGQNILTKKMILMK